MVSDEIMRQFDAIEERVEKLIEVCKTLEATNSDLSTRIMGLEKELQDKNEAEIQHIKQKDLIRGKIDSLLNKLNGFSKIGS